MALVYIVYQFFKYLLAPPAQKKKGFDVEEPADKTKKRKVSKEAGEYIDYEEVD